MLAVAASDAQAQRTELQEKSLRSATACALEKLSMDDRISPADVIAIIITNSCRHLISAVDPAYKGTLRISDMNGLMYEMVKQRVAEEILLRRSSTKGWGETERLAQVNLGEIISESELEGTMRTFKDHFKMFKENIVTTILAIPSGVNLRRVISFTHEQNFRGKEECLRSLDLHFAEMRGAGLVAEIESGSFFVEISGKPLVGSGFRFTNGDRVGLLFCFEGATGFFMRRVESYQSEIMKRLNSARP